MRQATRDLIEEIGTINWFSNCGAFTSPVISSPEIAVLGTLSEARRRYKSKKWERMTGVISNRTAHFVWGSGLPAEEINRRSYEAAGDHITQPIVERKGAIWTYLEYDPNLAWKVQLDLRMILSEIEFADIVRPLFAYPIVYPYYKSGFLPCGWEGPPISTHWQGRSPEDLPSGKLCVF